MILLPIALLPRNSLAIDVGRPGDRLFLSNVYGDELANGNTYRWTGNGGDTTITIPNWGGVRRIRLTMRLQAPLSSVPTDVQVLSGDNPVGMVRAETIASIQSIEIVVPIPGSPADTLALALRTPLVQIGDDPRQLGVILDTIRLDPLESDGRPLYDDLGRSIVLALFLTAFLVLLWPQSWLWGSGSTAAVLAAVALGSPWVVALLPVGLFLAATALAIRQRRWITGMAWRAWQACDDPRCGRLLVLLGIVAYAWILGNLVRSAPWIGHADYADNAVVARNIVQGRGFTVDYAAQFYRFWPGPSHPADTWPPLQPLLIALAFASLGVSTAAAKAPNLIVMVALLLVVYRYGANHWSPRVGLLADTFLALHGRLFEGVVYPLNDIPFMALSFACLTLLRSLTLAIIDPPSDMGSIGQPWTERWRHSRWAWAFFGILAGLLVLAKPSGVLLLAGAGGWACASGWHRGHLRLVLTSGLVALLTTAAIVAPWAGRNLATFGAPFFSTEQYDAWVLGYRDPEAIYQVYALRGDLPHPRLLVGYGFETVGDKIANQFHQAWQDMCSGKIAMIGLLLASSVGMSVIADARRRGLPTLLACAFVPYAFIIFTYWHYEPRYTIPLLPWVALLASAGIWWLHDRVAGHVPPMTRGIAALGTAAIIVALCAPQVAARLEDMEADQRTPSSVVVAAWLRDHTPPGTVIMTRNPWELAFHSGREAVMLPADDRAAIDFVANYYHATYLQLDHAGAASARRDLAPLYRGEDLPGFTRVYDNGNGVLVYRRDTPVP